MASPVTIQVKLTAQEWDDVRECLAFTHGNAVHFAKDNDMDFTMKLSYKAQAARLGALIESLKS